MPSWWRPSTSCTSVHALRQMSLGPCESRRHGSTGVAHALGRSCGPRAAGSSGSSSPCDGVDTRRRPRWTATHLALLQRRRRLRSRTIGQRAAPGPTRRSSSSSEVPGSPSSAAARRAYVRPVLVDRRCSSRPGRDQRRRLVGHELAQPPWIASASRAAPSSPPSHFSSSRNGSVTARSSSRRYVAQTRCAAGASRPASGARRPRRRRRRAGRASRAAAPGRRDRQHARRGCPERPSSWHRRCVVRRLASEDRRRRLGVARRQAPLRRPRVESGPPMQDFRSPATSSTSTSRQTVTEASAPSERRAGRRHRRRPRRARGRRRRPADGTVRRFSSLAIAASWRRPARDGRGVRAPPARRRRPRRGGVRSRAARRAHRLLEVPAGVVAAGRRRSASCAGCEPQVGGVVVRRVERRARRDASTVATPGDAVPNDGSSSPRPRRTSARSRAWSSLPSDGVHGVRRRWARRRRANVRHVETADAGSTHVVDDAVLGGPRRAVSRCGGCSRGGRARRRRWRRTSRGSAAAPASTFPATRSTSSRTRRRRPGSSPTPARWMSPVSTTSRSGAGAAWASRRSRAGA